MAEHETTPTIPPSRSAKFKRHRDTDVAPTDMTLGRRAEFRPSEEIAVRRDVLESFRQRLLKDIAGTSDNDEVKERAMFAAALADEATRHNDRSAMQLARLRRQTEFWSDEWAVVRRVHRRLGDPEVVADSLERSFVISRGLEKVLTGLERARLAWEQGSSPKKVASWVRRVMAEFDDAGRRALHQMPKFTAGWAVQLATDAAVEADHYDRALALWDAFLDHPELTSRDRQTVAATLGLWHYALGEPDEALAYLGAVGEQGRLHPDFENAWVHLMFAAGDRDGALRVLRKAADSLRKHGPAAAVLAQLESCAGQNERGVELLRDARQTSDDPVLLDLCLDLLEATDAQDELIDVLNQRLDTDLDVDRRAALLARLGRLYEAEAGLEEAAADVYREALELVPDHAPAIRALGRLYFRRRNFNALVELFEHEIEALEGSPTVWRRRFQVARLYENELKDLDRALAHYRGVLEVQPAYLPALKGAARILSDTESWPELADLFLQAAGNAPSKRQKLYLLDRVAEVAEARLQRWDVAIGAWEEILHMDPLHPRAFSSLGRLYTQTERWHDLLALNERELELVDDEEAAALLVRNAEIAEEELGRPDVAEQNYRRVLQLLPDYLPALEGLGRIYARGGRWGEIVTMTDAQLGATEDLREVKRQLGALAEIFEGQLDRVGDAIDVYERMLAADPADSFAYFNLLRLYGTSERWQEAFDLVERHERPGYEGRLAALAEWRLNRWDTAFTWYLRALEREPSNEHWLEGAARLWRPARVEPGELADRLENLLMAEMAADVRDRYFTVLARLREASEGTPDAGRAYRAHGDPSNLESLVVLRLAMAANGERDALEHARRTRPVMPWDEIANADRVRPPKSVIEALTEGSLDDEERRFIARETDLGYSRQFVKPGDGAWTELAAEMQRILAEPPTDELPEETFPEFIRLRAVEALESDDLATYVDLTAAECGVMPSRQIRIQRLLEVAGVLGGEQRREFLERAVREAFVELNGEMIDGPADGPVYDRLYDVLQDNGAWEELALALRTHVERDALSESRRVYLNAMLGAVCEDQLEQHQRARVAYEHCWEASRDPRYLRDLVRVAEEEGDLELAVDWQRRHFDATHAADSAPGARTQSGLWLAELLRSAGHGDEAIDCLESLADPQSESPLQAQLQRELARLHADSGDPRRAVELFQHVLPIHAVEEDAADWRALIRLQRDQLDDSGSAYSLQWKLVRSLPTSRRDLDDLIDFAIILDELPDCCAQLEALADQHEGAARIALLGRAAVALDEDLNHAEEASRLYEELLTETEEDPENYRRFKRRYAFCLSRIAGREANALEEFRALAASEPFEPSTYRGIVDLLERTQAYDRARVAHQILVALGCHVDVEFERPKTTPSREFEPAHVEHWLLPDGLRGGVLGCLRAVMPVAEKLWPGELPQRKALDGTRIKEGRLFDAVAEALTAFGIRKFKLFVGDAGPVSPQVLPDGTIWLNADVIEHMTDDECRFVAGYCAALAWSDVSNIIALDGRRIWHLLEGVQLKHTGQGFNERVDVESQRLGEEVGGAFYAVARRRVGQSLEVAAEAIAQAHCEAWPQMLDEFANRVGLALCGDVPAATSALLKLGGWDDELASPTTQARLKRTGGAEDLVRFAFSDSFLEARHAVGLAGRPSQLKI